MKKGFLLIVLFLMLCAPGMSGAAKLPATPKPDKKTLILAWERVQSQDPHTRKFEKIDANRYLLETDLFPFKDEVQVLYLAVDDEYPDEIEGFVIVQLKGVDKGFRELYSRNLSIWERHNRLYWSSDVDKWLTGKEYQDLQNSLTSKSKSTKKTGSKMSQESRALIIFGVFNGIAFAILFLGMGVVLFLMFRKQMALQKDLIEKQLNILAAFAHLGKGQQNTNMLLQGIYKRLGAARRPGQPKQPQQATPKAPGNVSRK